MGGHYVQKTKVRPLSSKWAGVVPYCNRSGLVFGICNTQVSSHNLPWVGTDWSRCLLYFKKVTERRFKMKIVVVKAPKFLRGILKSIFKIKNDTD